MLNNLDYLGLRGSCVKIASKLLCINPSSGSDQCNKNVNSS